MYMSKPPKSNKPIKAITDLAQSLKDVFNSYSLPTRKKIWKTINSAKGKKEIKKLINNPKRSVSKLRSIQTGQFKEFFQDTNFPSTTDQNNI